MAETASIAQNMHGEKLYQKRARVALPILVRQAELGKPIIYGALADEMGMPNARNLNYVLGSVGVSLNELATKSGRKIPPIQSLVINERHHVPGPGFDEFLINEGVEYNLLSHRQKRQFLEAFWLKNIYTFDWRKVLKDLQLLPIDVDFSTLIDKAINDRRLGGGEGPEHKALKEYVRCRPHIVGLQSSHKEGQAEYELPSGDRVDVVFESKGLTLAVEVKSYKSNLADIVRGLFQCVKYQAVVEAQHVVQRSAKDVQSILVLGGIFPRELVELRNSLGVRVVDNIAPDQ